MWKPVHILVQVRPGQTKCVYAIISDLYGMGTSGCTGKVIASARMPLRRRFCQRLRIYHYLISVLNYRPRQGSETVENYIIVSRHVSLPYRTPSFNPSDFLTASYRFSSIQFWFFCFYTNLVQDHPCKFDVRNFSRTCSLNKKLDIY